MTIPFRCASRYKQEMKCVCTVRSMVEFDIICLREQAHYRARRGEWIRLNSVVPHARLESLYGQSGFFDYFYRREIHFSTQPCYMSVPGIQAFSAISVIAEIGVDMSVFPPSKHLCSWAGLTPQNNESAGKKKTTRISRAGAYIKPLLVQCALGAVRTKHNPEIRNRYLSIKKRRGHKKAIIAMPGCC